MISGEPENSRFIEVIHSNTRKLSRLSTAVNPSDIFAFIRFSRTSLRDLDRRLYDLENLINVSPKLVQCIFMSALV